MTGTKSIPHARAREAIRTAVPDVTDDEIDETISIKAHFNPSNTDKYIARIVRAGNIAEFIPCGFGDKQHSNSCRQRDCAHCTISWCQGRCHQKRTEDIMIDLARAESALINLAAAMRG